METSLLNKPLNHGFLYQIKDGFHVFDLLATVTQVTSALDCVTICLNQNACYSANFVFDRKWCLLSGTQARRKVGFVTGKDWRSANVWFSNREGG